MSEILYPVAYGTQTVPMAELRRRHEPHMHPEFARRLFAWLEAQGGLVGIGGGYRPLGTQPDKPGFAPEGKSFHQPQKFSANPDTYAAVDLVVVNPGGVHRAPRWSEVPAAKSSEAARWGLHCHISTESWHEQPHEIRGWTSWVLAGRKDPVAGHPIPGPARRVFAPKPTQRRRLPGLGGLNSKAEVAALQNACNWWGWRDDHNRPLLPDGQFGALTEQAVMTMQRVVRTAPDGIYGPKSAAALQAFLDAMAALAA